MYATLRQQLFYSTWGLLLFAGFPWLLFLFNSPESIAALGRIGYFENGQFQYFPVKLLTEGTFQFIRLAYPILVLLFLAVTIAFFKPQATFLPIRLLEWLAKIRNFVKQELTTLSVPEKVIAGLTFLLVVIERCYYVLQYPVHTDEAASYLLFIQHGPFAIATFYPIPNNHLLQNLLAWPLTFIFQDPFWALRLPPLICGFLISFFGFLILKRFSGFLLAYLATSLFSFGSLTLFLSTQGRGYILLTLLAATCLGLLFKALQTSKASYWAAFSLAAVSGFFAVPVFAYPFAAFSIFAGLYLLFQKRWKEILKPVLAGLVTLTGALVLYTPLLLISGWKAVFGNRYVAPLTPQMFNNIFPSFLVEVQGELMGGKAGYGVRVFLLMLGILFLSFLFRKHSVFRKYLPAQTSWLIGLVLVMNLVIYSLLRFQLVLPPPRVLFFKSFFDYLGLGIALSFILKILIRNSNFRASLALAGVLIFAGFQLKTTERFLQDYPQPYYTSPALNNLILEKNARKVYVEEAFYQLFLEYEFARAGQHISIQNQVQEPVPRYDFVVLEHDRPFPEKIPEAAYREIYRDALVRAYVPKN